MAFIWTDQFASVAIMGVNSDKHQTKISPYMPAVGLAVTGLVLAVVAYAWPVAGVARMALIFPPSVPFLEAHARVVAAGGLVVRSGALPFILIVEPISNKEPTFSWRKTGALFVINPQFAGGCLQ